MKYVLEFGVRGGAHTENKVIPTKALAEALARTLVRVFCNDPSATDPREWVFRPRETRKYWFNSTHFVAVSKLDGVLRGPASSTLWRLPTKGSEEQYLGRVVSSTK